MYATDPGTELTQSRKAAETPSRGIFGRNMEHAEKWQEILNSFSRQKTPKSES
jgi:hypothetical protein